MKRLPITILLSLISISVFAIDFDTLIRAGKEAKDDGNYSRAKYFYEQALAQIPADSIVQTFEINSLLRNLCMFNLKEYEASITYGKRALNIMKKYGGMNPGLAEEYNMVANAYSEMGNSGKCFCYLDSAAQCLLMDGGTMREKIGGFWTIGATYAHFDNWSEASNMYKLAVSYSKKEGLSDRLISSLNLYANSLYKQDKYTEAKNIYDEQIAATELLYGKDSEQYRWAYLQIANILAFNGDIIGGSKCLMDVVGQYRNVLVEQLRTIPSEKRETYLGGAIEIIYNMIPFGVAAGNNEDEFTEMAYNGLLLTKGLLLASDKSASEIIELYGSDEDKTYLIKLNSLQHQLTDLEASVIRDTDKILSVYNEIKRLDNLLAQSCAAYGNISSFADISYNDIKSKLKDDEVILDFTDYKPKSKPRQYVCFEISRNQKYPKLHYVCNSGEIDSLLNLEKGKWSNLYTGESAQDMSRIIGKPLTNIIKGSKVVYYVPSGMFHKLSIEAITNGESLLGDCHDFHRLSSAREIISDAPSSGDMSATLYGGLTYGTGIKTLPRSLEEVSVISKMIPNSSVLSGNRGDKESFLKMTDIPSILHFSTHGFYYNPEDRNLPISLKGYNDAMSLSGMVMAGGDLRSKEGLITAEEISRCNLAKTEIACLASCHSGQGEVTPEGIYGLQRAFKKAGVESVILNLWEASDVATKCFMTCFYDDLFNGSKDRHKAYLYAMNTVREQYPSPYYWAGFVMID